MSRSRARLNPALAFRYCNEGAGSPNINPKGFQSLTAFRYLNSDVTFDFGDIDAHGSQSLVGLSLLQPLCEYRMVRNVNNPKFQSLIGLSISAYRL